MRIPKKIANNKYFLVRYYLISHVAILAALAVLGSINSWHHLFLDFPPTSFLLIALMLAIGFGGILMILLCLALSVPLFVLFGNFALPALWDLVVIFFAATLLGIYSAGLMHHASHGHFRNRIIDRVIGELCALHQLIGFYGWKIPHIAHHLNADVEGKDPHAPLGMGFIAYSRKIKSDVLNTLKDSYFDTFPNAPTTWRLSFAMIWLNRVLRVLFWYALLGLENFVLFYVTSYLVQLTFYVHFNWVTHKKSESGENLIRDLNQGLYYRVVNRAMWGMFYHGTHHRYPSLMDPRAALLLPSSAK